MHPQTRTHTHTSGLLRRFACSIQVAQLIRRKISQLLNFGYCSPTPEGRSRQSRPAASFPTATYRRLHQSGPFPSTLLKPNPSRRRGCRVADAPSPIPVETPTGGRGGASETVPPTANSSASQVLKFESKRVNLRRPPCQRNCRGARCLMIDSWLHVGWRSWHVRLCRQARHAVHRPTGCRNSAQVRTIQSLGGNTLFFIIFFTHFKHEGAHDGTQLCSQLQRLVESAWRRLVDQELGAPVGCPATTTATVKGSENALEGSGKALKGSKRSMKGQ